MASFKPHWSAAWERLLSTYEFPRVTYEFRWIEGYLYYYHAESYPDEALDSCPSRLVAVMDRLMDYWCEELLPKVREIDLYWNSLNPENMSAAALLERLEETTERYTRLWELHWLILQPMAAAWREYTRLYQELFGTENPLEPAKLLKGFLNKSVESTIELSRLSQRFRNTEVSQVLRTNTVAGALEALRLTGEGTLFLKELQTYLETFGHRFDMWDWTNPTWREEPTAVLHAIKDMLQRPDYILEAELNAAAAEREAAVLTARRRLQGYPAPVRHQFDRLLKAAQEATVLQEDHNFWIDYRCHAAMRSFLLGIGKRFAKDGVLLTGEDIWYLMLSEVKAVLVGTMVDLSSLVATRRAELARWASVDPPPVLGTANLLAHPVASAPQAPRGLVGSPGSAGVVRGRARVVHSLDEGTTLLPGEILVASSIAPSWTLLFARAAAVVTESGGILGHCAIVAREFGIPAVLNAENATRCIRSGQLVEVNGSVGTIRCLEE